MTTEIVSTYRLQFHKGFTFRHAADIVPYLHDLGITHVYASPYLKAVAGSTHGYDVIDHSQFNPEIGTEQDYRHFVETLSSHGMSHILDTVPNHMGVETNDNQWWNDVLANGHNSQYANYFDVDWAGFALRRELKGKVLLPVLGETLAKAIEGGKLQIKQEGDKRFVCYYDRRFPIDSASETQVSLADLLDEQHYRLSYWRVAADEINYRRFFDISGLAALQMQRSDVFEDVHRFTFSLIADGSVAGLRVDHPDGLLDPQQYFDRLQAKYQSSCPQLAAEKRDLFVSVEKILNGDETLCDDWHVAGTSGYDFLYAVNDLYVNPVSESAMTEIYSDFVNDSATYTQWVYQSKCVVLDNAMFSEMTTLTNRLDALAQLEISSRDFTRRQLHDALRELIACFPVYRTYVSVRGVSRFDASVVETAVEQARVCNPKLSPGALEFVQESVLLRYPVSPAMRDRQLDFAQRFQQLTSPVNAKGVEDTTFYIYNRLTSLNEVGGDPGRFGRGSGVIHKYFAHRQAHWPLSLSSLSTHDTKRSEDVRARVNVLAAIPERWSEHLTRWKTLNAEVAMHVHPNDQYLLYQTLLGAWPLPPMDKEQRKDFTGRISAYMQKATREAKLRNSWIDPNKEYESQINQLIENLVDPEKGRAFLADFLPFQEEVSQIGLRNSLSQTVIRLTAPGISDTYQGTELLDFSLVDPDNRRPVDYTAREKMLAGMNLKARGNFGDFISSLTGNMNDGQIKLWITHQLLKFRKSFPQLFLRGSYEPLSARGSRADQLFSFSRTSDTRQLLVIVPRLIASAAGKWEDTTLLLPRDCTATRFENILTREPINASNREIQLTEAFRTFPVAVLVTVQSRV